MIPVAILRFIDKKRALNSRGPSYRLKFDNDLQAMHSSLLGANEMAIIIIVTIKLSFLDKPNCRKVRVE